MRARASVRARVRVRARARVRTGLGLGLATGGLEVAVLLLALLAKPVLPDISDGLLVHRPRQVRQQLPLLVRVRVGLGLAVGVGVGLQLPLLHCGVAPAAEELLPG